MTKHLDTPYIEHIKEAIYNIESFIKGYSREDFYQSIEKQSAVVRQIEVIGEAAKNLSIEFGAKYPQIPWKEIIGMRDKIIHKYFEVDLNIIWDVIKKNLPKLKRNINEILKEIRKENSLLSPK